jgi:pyruvate/2-oxoacid:ferredoxin oxidoreductase beta subunit
VRDYLKLQGHFSHLTEKDIEFIQENVDREWERLVGKAGTSR